VFGTNIVMAAVAGAQGQPERAVRLFAPPRHCLNSDPTSPRLAAHSVIRNRRPFRLLR
jgi:hypothetical protein